MEFKRCPFCGSEVRLEIAKVAVDDYGEPLYGYYVECSDCCVCFEGYFTTEEEAVSAWNRRAEVKEEQP